MSQKIVSVVKISDLVKAGWNPPRRTEKGKYKALMTSIERIGLIYPILVTKDLHVLDGHRRLASCVELGMEEIPVLFAYPPEGVLPQQVFAEVNAYSVHLQGNDVLHIYLQDKSALTSPQLGKAEEAEQVLGRNMLRKLEKAGLSLQSYQWAKKVAVYCDRFNPEFMRKVVEWIVLYRSSALRTALTVKMPAHELERAILKRRPIQERLVVSQ